MEEVLSADADLSTDELFARVLDIEAEEDSFLRALVALHDRPTQQVLDRSTALMASDDANDRCVGLRILRELDHPTTDADHRWARAEPVVVELAASDEDPDVVRWAISCLAYRAHGAGALTAVLGQAGHDDRRVRFAVAAALPALAGENGADPRAVAALKTLTGDPDPDARSYALMGLVGDLGLADECRAILRAHLADPDPQIRDYCRKALAGEL